MRKSSGLNCVKNLIKCHNKMNKCIYIYTCTLCKFVNHFAFKGAILCVLSILKRVRGDIHTVPNLHWQIPTHYVIEIPRTWGFKDNPCISSSRELFRQTINSFYIWRTPPFVTLIILIYKVCDFIKHHHILFSGGWWRDLCGWFYCCQQLPFL